MRYVAVLLIVILLAVGCGPATNVPLRGSLPRHEPTAAPPAAAVAPTPQQYATGEIIVRWADPEQQPSLPGDILGVVGRLADGQVVRLAVPAGRESDLARELAALPGVVWAQPNYLRRSTQLVDDPRLPEQWALSRLNVPQAWEITRGAPFVVVAVIDSGVDLEHPDLKWRLIQGYNFVDRGTPPQDDVGHGTHAAGIIAATANNGIGIAGVAPNVSIMPIKALRIETSIIGSVSAVGEDFVVAESMRYAVDNGAWIINMSFDGRSLSPILEEAVAYATARGVVLVAAAGNGSRMEPSYPAANKPTIAVAATDVDDTRLFYTNYGSWIDVGAPGKDILSTSWNPFAGSNYRSSDGTSTSAPLVAGIVALMFAVRPTLTIDEIVAVLRTTADPLTATGLGGGRVNARRAVEAVSPLELLPPGTTRLPAPALAEPQQPPTPMTPGAVATGAPTLAPRDPTTLTPAVVTVTPFAATATLSSFPTIRAGTPTPSTPGGGPATSTPTFFPSLSPPDSLASTPSPTPTAALTPSVVSTPSASASPTGA